MRLREYGCDMRFRDARTVRAIGELRGSYPYAAALLSYVVVERVLKRSALAHWQDHSLAQRAIPTKIQKHGGKELQELQHLTERQRLHEVLSKMTLGEVEVLLCRSEKDKCGSDRNEIMHSDLYLKNESTLSRAKQVQKNKARFDLALTHLRLVLEHFEGLAIVEKNGVLATQPHAR